MRTSVAITLIITGTLLIMVPAISDYLLSRNLMHILTASHGQWTSVNLNSGNMGDLYRLACWSTGTLMIAFAAISALRPPCLEDAAQKRREETESSPIR